jgi:hypothetical protein
LCPVKLNQSTVLKEIKDIVSKFSSVSLEEINEVKLMSRIDRKYWFHISKLLPLLESALDYYDILEINGERIMDYQTTYFDTEDSLMYLKHHNKKLNRVKIRQRNYVSTNNSFLEVKFKTNKKRTIKTRIATDFGPTEFIQPELDFIDDKTPFKGEELQPSLSNKFKRITLIHKQKLDRCTIDINPEFWDENGKTKIENLVIFEVKRGRSLKLSPIVSNLRNLKIRQKGLSKYCTGRAILDNKLKQNAFKRRLNFITKKIN